MYQELQQSDYRIRKLIGILGLLLPLMLIVSEGEILASISHYYYKTLSSLIFIIVLSAFALFLLSYKGYKKHDNESLSDDLITNIGGLAALIVVFIPTCCSESGSVVIDTLCYTGQTHLFGHDKNLKGAIHLISAGVFIFSMGWMSKYKFTRSANDKYNKIYKFCGNLVWISVGAIIFLIILEKLGVNFWLKDYYVFIFEVTAIVPFGISWLIKGKVIDDIKSFRIQPFRKASATDRDLTS